MIKITVSSDPLCITPPLLLTSVLWVLLRHLLRNLLSNISHAGHTGQPSGHHRYPSHEKNQAKNLSLSKTIPRSQSRSEWDHLRQLITIETPRREQRYKQILSDKSQNPHCCPNDLSSWASVSLPLESATGDTLVFLISPLTHFHLVLSENEIRLERAIKSSQHG